MNEMYDKVPTVDELIEMLVCLREGITPHLSPRRKTTLILDIYPESAEFVLDETINYLKSIKEEK